jgi:hypothetical protein
MATKAMHCDNASCSVQNLFTDFCFELTCSMHETYDKLMQNFSLGVSREEATWKIKARM